MMDDSLQDRARTAVTVNSDDPRPVIRRNAFLQGGRPIWVVNAGNGACPIIRGKGNVVRPIAERIRLTDDVRGVNGWIKTARGIGYSLYHIVIGRVRVDPKSSLKIPINRHIILDLIKNLLCHASNFQ